MAGYNRLPQTANNDPFQRTSLYNDYLPSESAQAMHEICQTLDITPPRIGAYGFNMTDRNRNANATASTQRPDTATSAQQNAGYQQANSFALQRQTLPQQNQYLQYRQSGLASQLTQYGLQSPTKQIQKNVERQAQVIPTQYQKYPDTRQQNQNGQASRINTANPPQQYPPQGQRLPAQQLQYMQRQHLPQMMAYTQPSNHQNMQQYPLYSSTGIPPIYAVAYSDQIPQSLGQVYPPQRTPKRPLTGDEVTTPSPKRVRGPQSSPGSAVVSPQSVPLVHPDRYAMALSQQQQRQVGQQRMQQQLRQQQIWQQQQQRILQQNFQQQRHHSPATPYRSPSTQSSHSVEQGNSILTAQSPQRYSGHPSAQQVVGQDMQRQYTPKPASPSLQKAYSPIVRPPQSLRRTDMPLIDTAVNTPERQKMLKAGFIKTPNQTKRRSTSNQPATPVPQARQPRQKNQQPSPVSTPALSASPILQYLTQPIFQRAASVVQRSSQQPIYVDPLSKDMQQESPSQRYSTPSIPSQAEVQRQQSPALKTHVKPQQPNVLRQNHAKQNLNIMQQRQMSYSNPAHQQKEAATGSVPRLQTTTPTTPIPVPFPNQPQVPTTSKVLPASASNATQPTRSVSPKENEWTTYVVDRVGTRHPKSKPPPQGSYYTPTTSGFAVEARDYSDPRDFFAPTGSDKHHVWTALGPTRDDYFKITGIKLEKRDLLCLDMGYNAAWDEIKRNIITWAFDNYSPDPPPETKSGPDQGKTVEVKLVEDEALPGYSRYEVIVAGRKITESSGVEAAKRAREAGNFFRHGNFIFNPAKRLFKLERWYGLVDAYAYSPNWPAQRPRNRAGVPTQNPQAYACTNCRESGRLCYGHKEHPSRKCIPCQEFQLECSKEELYVQRGPGRLEKLPAKPNEHVAQPDRLGVGKLKFAGRLAKSYQPPRGRAPSVHVTTTPNATPPRPLMSTTTTPVLPARTNAPGMSTGVMAPVTNATATARTDADAMPPPRGRGQGHRKGQTRGKFGQRNMNWMQ